MAEFDESVRNLIAVPRGLVQALKKAPPPNVGDALVWDGEKWVPQVQATSQFEAPAAGRYITHRGMGTVGPQQGDLDVAVFMALDVPRDLRVDRIGVEVAANVADAKVRLGIYTATVDGSVGTLLLDAGQREAATTGIKEIAIDQELTAGRYYCVAVPQVARASLQALQHSLHIEHWPAAPVARFAFSTPANVSGALPETPTLGTASAAWAPRVFLRVAA